MKRNRLIFRLMGSFVLPLSLIMGSVSGFGSLKVYADEISGGEAEKTAVISENAFETLSADVIGVLSENEPAGISEDNALSENEVAALSGDAALSENRSEDTQMVYVDLSDKLIHRGAILKAESPEQTGEEGAYGSANYSGAKKAIEDAVKKWNGKSTITVELGSYGIPVSDTNFISSVINAHPEFFYLTGAFSYYYSGGCYTTISLDVDENYSPADLEKFTKAGDLILSGVKEAWTPLQKALYIHDYIVTHTDYYFVGNVPGDKFNAYNVLVENTAVCQGYSEAYQYLMNRIDEGFECDVISSDAKNHAWNIITVGGKKYYIDCTWDDPAGSTQKQYRYYCGHENFMRSRDRFYSDCKHNSTDWVNTKGEKIYNTIIGGTEYDDAPWFETRGVVPMIGNAGAYVKDYDKASVYKYDFLTGNSNKLADYTAKWNVWGSSSYWLDNFSGLGAIGDKFVVTTPDKVLVIDKNGGSPQTKYTLSAAEKGKGYIYGAIIEGINLKYDLYTSPQTSTGKSELSGTLDLSEYSTDVPVESVTLNKSSLSLTVGKSETLTATVLPKESTFNSVTWKSSDPSVASVDEKGTVKGLSAGTTDITAACGGIKSAACRVTVTGSSPAPEPVIPDVPDVPDVPDTPVPPVSGNKPSAFDTCIGQDSDKDIYLVKGQKYFLDPGYAWESSDKKKVSVSAKYKITAKAKGEATLTSSDGAGVFTAHVADPKLNVKSRTLITGQQLKIGFDDLGDEDRYSVFWYSSNPECARVKEGTVYAGGKGSAVITACLNGKAFTCRITVKDNTGSIPKTGGAYLFKPLQKAKIPAKGFTYSGAEWSSSSALSEVYNSKGRLTGWKNDVVYIDKNGTITAIGVGTTDLKAVDKKSKVLDFTITVKAPQTHVVFINTSKAKKWSFLNLDMKKVDWKTSDSSIADMDKGKIVAGQVSGTATITGNYDPYMTGKGFDYTIKVYVEDPVWMAAGLVSLKPSKYSFDAEKNGVYKLESKGVYQTVVFKSSNNFVAFIDEYGRLHALNPGKANLTTKLNGKTYTITVKVSAAESV